MRSEKDFFSEFYYSGEIVTVNEGNVEVVSISRALCISSHIMNNLITLFTRARGSVHKAKISSLISLEC